jgi:hypothetical protein
MREVVEGDGEEEGPQWVTLLDTTSPICKMAVGVRGSRESKDRRGGGVECPEIMREEGKASVNRLVENSPGQRVEGILNIQ